MPPIVRLLAIIILLDSVQSPSVAHEALEDARGCRFDDERHHCHDQDGDVGEFFAILSIAGFFAYIFL